MWQVDSSVAATVKIDNNLQPWNTDLLSSKLQDEIQQSDESDVTIFQIVAFHLYPRRW